MSYSQEFSQAAGKSATAFTKVGPAVVRYQYSSAEASMTSFDYDFIMRMVSVRVKGKEHTHLMHFREIEPDTLAYMRDRLIALGGTPPPLPVAAPEEKTPSPIRKAP